MIRNILLRGLPRSGKTTLLEKAISGLEQKKGFITREIRENGERTGFEVITDEGKAALLASIHLRSDIRVSRYFVDITGFEALLPGLYRFSDDHVLYLDEIGQMELHSKKFKELVNSYLDAENLLIATISQVYSDDFTRKILARPDIIVLEVNPLNRESVYHELKSLIEKRRELK